MRKPFLLVLAALLGAEASLAQTVMPVRPIRSHAILSASDLALTDDESLPGAVGSIEAAIGLEAKVTLYPGRPVLESQIGPPALIERNQLVRMVYDVGVLSIMTEGRALDRAGLGEPVRVMNLASRQIVTGSVSPDGSIEVGK